MIIRAKKGTVLEDKLRELHEKKIKEQNRAFEYAERVFGQKPICMTYTWGPWFNFNYAIEKEVVFPSPLQNPPKYVEDLSKDKEYRYKLSRRYKYAREEVKKFREEFRGISHDLEEVGIKTKVDLRYSSWDVIRDECGTYVFMACDWCFEDAPRDQFDVIMESDIDNK